MIIEDRNTQRETGNAYIFLPKYLVQNFKLNQVQTSGRSRNNEHKKEFRAIVGSTQL